MKNIIQVSCFGLVILLTAFGPLARLRAGDIAADNITIQQAALFGSVYTDTSATATSEGLRIDTSQASAEVYHTSTIPEHYQNMQIMVEDWGYVPATTGHDENVMEWQQVAVGQIPATYDENNVEITPASTYPIYDWVAIGTRWVSDPDIWAIIGSHPEYRDVLIPAQTNTWTETTNGGTPRVRFNATRSDTNFAFRVPSPTGPDGMKDILVVWQGGLTLPSDDPNRTSVLTMGGLQQGWSGWDGAQTLQKTSSVSVHALTLTTNAQRYVESVQHCDTSVNESRPESIRLIRTETVSGYANTAQTQIAAKSATFAGVVEVAGNLKVGGALLIQPQGDLVMGAYTNGPQP